MARWSEVELELHNRRKAAPKPVEVIEFDVPIKIESEMNKRDHWSVRKKRFDAQRTAVWAAWPRKRGKVVTLAVPVLVTLTRVGKRRLDSDNLAGGFKSVRDEIARILGVDDGSPKIRFAYEQTTGKAYAASVRIEPEIPWQCRSQHTWPGTCVAGDPCYCGAEKWPPFQWTKEDGSATPKGSQLDE